MSEQTMTSHSFQTSAKPSLMRRLYTADFSFNFVGNASKFFIAAAVILAVCIASLAIRGLNLGIDFKGGSVFQVPVQVTSSTVDDFSATVSDTGIENLSAEVRTIGDQAVRIQTRSLSTEEVSELRAALAAKAEVTSDDVAYSLIGPSWGQQITQKALIALAIFTVLVGVLIWIYFRNAKMSVAALAALAHDLVVTVGLYALVGFTVTPSTVIAVLTIMGYSLYDTVVVFDMVRERTKTIKEDGRTFSEAANEAINHVLVRSINTTIIAVLPVAAILIAGVLVLGGEGPLPDLGLAMLIGMIAGAYSSICLATPILAVWREREPDMVAHRKSLEKHQSKHRPRVQITTAEIDSDSDHRVDVAKERQMHIDAGHTDSNGRVQPKRTTRAQRKK